MSHNKARSLFSNLILLSGALFCVLGIIYYVILYITHYTHYTSYTEHDVSLAIFILNKNWYKYIIIFAICSISLILGVRLKIGVRVILSKWLLALLIAVYGIELFLYLNQPDYKDRSDYVNTLKNKGIELYPALGSHQFLKTNGLKTNEGKKILPLGGFSNKPTLTFRSKESGSTTVYESDEHGFNNKKGMYSQEGVDIVILGTCYEEYQGLLDVSEENLGEVLRKLGYKAINLSKAGSNILSNFATLKEYGEPLNPKVTLLFYHDKDDLVSARKISMFSDKTSHPESPILLRYLNEDNFTQNLILKQDIIDNLMIEFLKLNEIETTNQGKVVFDELLKVWKLYHFRSKIKLDTSAPLNTTAPISDDFIKILEKLKNLASNWNGVLYLVRIPSYIPPFKVYSKNINESDIKFKMVQKLASKLGIRVIDLHEELLDRHPNPSSLFGFGSLGFANAKFYKLTGEVISKRLQKDRIM